MSSRLAIYGIPRNGLEMQTRHVICAVEAMADEGGLDHVVDYRIHYWAMLSACECCGGTDKPCEACLEMGQ